jgi:two-component system C4-dicarboxylate transport response regulator DctD
MDGVGRLAGTVAKILVVDDDADGREALVTYLTKGGHSALGAASGREALDALEKMTGEVPDLVLLDIRMPGMDGFAVLKVLRSYLRWASVPVAILTAYPEDPRLWYMREHGVERIFAKTRTDLAHVLAWVDQRTARQRHPDQPSSHAGA